MQLLYPRNPSTKAGFETFPLLPKANKASILPPRSIMEQSSFMEGIVDDHSIQSNTDSTVKVFVAPFKTESELTTTKTPAGLVTSGHESSEGSVDNTSIFFCHSSSEIRA